MYKRLWDPSEGLVDPCWFYTDPTPHVPSHSALWPATTIAVGTGQRPCCEVIRWSFLIMVLLTSVPGFFWGVPEAETLGGFVPCSSTRGVCSQEEDKGWNRWVPGSSTWHYLEKMLWTEQKHPILLYFSFIFWAEQSCQSSPEKTERWIVDSWL